MFEQIAQLVENNADEFVKLLLALGIGGIIGLERQFRDKAAGVRTMMLICVGSALFTIYSIKIGGESVDRTRIAANIVSGVGFLGAGAIIRDAGRVVGLTTASTIWIVAALGMGVGSGEYVFSVGALIAVLLALLIFSPIERAIGRWRERRTYRVTCLVNASSVSQLESILAKAGLKVRGRKQKIRDGKIICTWDTMGRVPAHERAAEQLLKDSRVEELNY
jgi:putative Mg2+ transporter-C (MgtC) family protein